MREYIHTLNARARVRTSKVVEDTGVSREELWAIVQKTKIEAFVDCIAMNLPGAEGLLSVTITKREDSGLKVKTTHTYQGDEIRSTISFESRAQTRT